MCLWMERYEKLCKAKKEAKMMGVSEDDMIEEEVILGDFEKAEEIFNRIVTKIGKPEHDFSSLLFALCLIYSRQLAHHKYEEAK